jgi:hypothetical protein
MVNITKRVIFRRGKVAMPLSINANATIYHMDGTKTVTPAVVAVKKTTKKLIVFETQEDYIYYVVPQFVPATKVINKNIPVCA